MHSSEDTKLSGGMGLKERRMADDLRYGVEERLREPTSTEIRQAKRVLIQILAAAEHEACEDTELNIRRFSPRHTHLHPVMRGKLFRAATEQLLDEGVIQRASARTLGVVVQQGYALSPGVSSALELFGKGPRREAR